MTDSVLPLIKKVLFKTLPQVPEIQEEDLAEKIVQLLELEVKRETRLKDSCRG